MYIAVTRQDMDSFPEYIKCTDSIYELQDFLKGWYRCKCYLCIG